MNDISGAERHVRAGEGGAKRLLSALPAQWPREEYSALHALPCDIAQLRNQWDVPVPVSVALRPTALYGAIGMMIGCAEGYETYMYVYEIIYK